jgi:hypothetical protein
LAQKQNTTHGNKRARDEPYLQAKPEKARNYGVAGINRALAGVDGPTIVHMRYEREGPQPLLSLLLSRAEIPVLQQVCLPGCRGQPSH